MVGVLGFSGRIVAGVDVPKVWSAGGDWMLWLVGVICKLEWRCLSGLGVLCGSGDVGMVGAPLGPG